MTIIPTAVLCSCILPRLSVKILTRFKSVSKSWRRIISSPEFIRHHHHHALSSDANRLIVFVDWDLDEFHIHELDSPVSPSLHWYNPEPAPRFMLILASCEFSLLIDFNGTLGLVLLNPSTGRYYQIPYSPSYLLNEESYGIYLDEDNHDYKIVRITQKCFSEINIEVRVYSIKTNKWRLIERRLNKSFAWCDYSAVIGHSLHIIFSPDTNSNINRIGCFDILGEKWTNDVPMPPINVRRLTKLAVLDGLLCVITLESVWVMKEYGVKDSWFKLMNITSNDIWNNTTPIAFRKGSQDEVLCIQGNSNKLEYIWHNAREKKATTATTEGNFGYICKGSLVDFPGGRNMKLHQPKQAEETIRFSQN